MKISKSLRDLHAGMTEEYERLRREVDNFMETHKEHDWHYVSRLKDLESFALKVETGRSNPAEMEDFFACTLVVDNLASMGRAENLVKKRFKLKERRPVNDKFTSKPSDSFRFDDTRLYVRWKDSGVSRPTGIKELLFEVQVKTFLAHAWGIASHDLVYKSDEKSWPKERIAFQIKAMLEHAEVSIVEAENLAGSASLLKSDAISDRISSIIRMAKKFWPPEALPGDTKRLAENIERLMTRVGIDLKRLEEVLAAEAELGRGSKTLNLSPYSAVVQSLLNQETSKIVGYLKAAKGDFNVYMASDLEIPVGVDLAMARNAVYDPSRQQEGFVSCHHTC